MFYWETAKKIHANYQKISCVQAIVSSQENYSVG